MNKASSLVGTKGVRVSAVATKAVKDDPRAYDWVISTGTVDRDGEVLVPRGAKWKGFLEAGGGVTWMHRDSEYPIAKAERIEHGDNAIIARVRFPEKPEAMADRDDWEPDYVLGLVQAGMVKATSVSLLRLPSGVREASKADRVKYGEDCRMVTSKWEMLNFSLVNIPANPEALLKCVKDGRISAAAAKRFGQIDESRIGKARIVVPAIGEIDRIEMAAKRAVAKAKGFIYLRNG
jgi:hypothetical protein